MDAFRQKYFPRFRSLLRESSDLDAAVSVVDPAWNEIVPTTYLISREIDEIRGTVVRQTMFAEFEKVTPELIMKTAQEYLRKTNRTILTVPGKPATSINTLVSPALTRSKARPFAPRFSFAPWPGSPWGSPSPSTAPS